MYFYHIATFRGCRKNFTTRGLAGFLKTSEKASFILLSKTFFHLSLKTLVSLIFSFLYYFISLESIVVLQYKSTLTTSWAFSGSTSYPCSFTRQCSMKILTCRIHLFGSQWSEPLLIECYPYLNSLKAVVIWFLAPRRRTLKTASILEAALFLDPLAVWSTKSLTWGLATPKLGCYGREAVTTELSWVRVTLSMSFLLDSLISEKESGMLLSIE